MEIKYTIDENECWICTSHKPNSSGYPTTKIKGKCYRVYRLYYEKYKDRIPENMLVRHTCDNTLCVNPEHLILGTTYDNIQDRVSRNRSAIGVNNGRSKLSEKEVLEIFNSLDSSWVLSKKYSIDPKTVRNIKAKKIWKNLLK